MPKRKIPDDKSNSRNVYTIQSFQNVNFQPFRFCPPAPLQNPYLRYDFQTWNNPHNWRRRPTKRYQRQEKKGERPSSPFTGTEEYTLKKIQEASDMIKKRLLLPESEDSPTRNTPEDRDSRTARSNERGDKTDKSPTKASKKVHYDVKEIHTKIINHITKLSHGKKMNLIRASSSGYDVAIQQIHKQKRLELSKVLRDMCSNQTTENSEAINSIIPDIGIKIEDLPLEVIQQLSTTLDCNFDAFPPSVFSSSNCTVSNSETTDDLEYAVEKPDDNPSSDLLIHESEIKTECLEPQTDIKEEVTISIKEEQIDIVDIIDNRPQFVDKGQNTEQNNTDISVQTDAPSNASVQTETATFHSESCQTDFPSEICSEIDVKNIDNLHDAVVKMYEIDKEVTRLTKLRQAIFSSLQKKKNVFKHVKKTGKSPVNTVKPKKEKSAQKAAKPKSKEKLLAQLVDQEKNIVAQKAKGKDETVIVLDDDEPVYTQPVQFNMQCEKILTMKIIQETLLAASDQGTILYINAINGAITANIKVTDFPITTLCYWVTPKRRQIHLLVGTTERKLHEYNYETRTLVRLTHLNDSVQCMELAWNCVFIGTANGSLLRYSLKQRKIEFQEKISVCAVMVLKATQEGARRVLLVGMQNAPVCIRDAMSGLHLRSMDGFVTPSAYSLVLENGLVYCGTNFYDIMVFSFHDGNMVYKHQNSTGITCLKVMGNLLFASSCSGKIYVYNIKTRLIIGTINGPGGAIVSMEILKNIVIVSTMEVVAKLSSVIIPDHILEQSSI